MRWARLQEMKRHCPLVGDVRGRGLLLGIDLVRERAGRTPAPEVADRVLYRALSRGLSFKTTMGHVLTLTPPLTVTVAQMDQALDVVAACLAEEVQQAGA